MRLGLGCREHREPVVVDDVKVNALLLEHRVLSHHLCVMGLGVGVGGRGRRRVRA